jgi:hypothetical protein
MLRQYVLDESGEPVRCDDLMTWGRYMQGDRHIGDDHIGDIHVSTVFLGLDHSFERSGPPVLWETMIFGGEHDEYQERYTSREEALKGHAKALALVRGGSDG